MPVSKSMSFTFSRYGGDRAGGTQMNTSATNRFATRARTFVGSTLIGAAALVGFAGQASAALPDNQFAALLNQKGITFSSPAVAVGEANVVCSKIGRGESFTSVLEDLHTADPTLSQYQAGYFIGASVASYCPQSISTLPR
jgi:hypothetical protein